ncbi:MAG: hypothetical protein H0X37_26160, partial [Herpetosiphonaceae bacterium]|nr:hypothetical protein [Herpetosiphonaceae bacterium]
MPDLPRFFDSADLVSIQELSANESYAPFPRLCSTLGLDPTTEAEYAAGYPILAAGIRTIDIRTAWGLEPTPCLRADLVPFWLLTLQYAEVEESAQTKLAAYQRECASILWQQFRPQGFSPEDALLPQASEFAPADHGYISEMAQANLARQQMLIERQLNEDRDSRGIDDPQALTLAQAVRRVAQSLAARTYRNEYGGVFQGLYRQFGITSYRRMPQSRLYEALEWLE